ncbi:Yvgn And cofactor Nadph [Bacillus manliponensis]|uniref:Yvgn And cofactor Nadph n=1 Tax=Bacillus manliponensis TaxID=574376 RepID=A0A073JXA5_9BACI|nr:DUF2953 domain-containing protein [Bacillus manliponensis]KEK18905.1 Yvgn And cofactor Nadph [Bacillus manliponensis]
MIRMKWLLIGVVIVVIFLFVILLSKLSIKVSLLYTESEQQCLFEVKIWMVHFTFDVLERMEKQQRKTEQKIEKAEEKGGAHEKFVAQLDSIEEIIKKLQHIHTMSKDFLQKVKINQFRWHSQIGTGDAASTGIVTGYVWSVKGIIIGLLGQYTELVHEPKLEITPIFQGKTVASKCEFTASFRIYRAVKTAVGLLMFMRRQSSSAKDKTVQI